MKRMILTAAVTAIWLSALPALAQQPSPADKGAQATQVAPNVGEFDKQMAQVQENMKKMQEQMNKLRQSQDPQERQRLLQDHWATMHTPWG